jgi:hypothetical protein
VSIYVFGYGEDALTLWALVNRLDTILEQLGDQAGPDARLPPSVLQEDAGLLMYYDNALMRAVAKPAQGRLL